MSDPDEILAEVRLLRGDVRVLSDALNRSRWIVRILSALCAALLLVSGGLVYTFQGSRSQASCVREWANAYAGRTNTLVPASTARANALDSLLLSLQTKDKAKFEAAYALYVKASADYARLAADNPPPTAPQYTC